MAKEIYEVFTLFDITYTGTKRNFNSKIIPFVDQAHQKIINSDTWQISRNQQRNWDTTIQLLGLRTQIISHTYPICVKESSLEQFDRIGNANVWHFTCEYEQENMRHLLEQDFNDVPMITGLNESVELIPACYKTLVHSNIYFKKIEF